MSRGLCFDEWGLSGTIFHKKPVISCMQCFQESLKGHFDDRETTPVPPTVEPALDSPFGRGKWPFNSPLKNSPRRLAVWYVACAVEEVDGIGATGRYAAKTPAGVRKLTGF